MDFPSALEFPGADALHKSRISSKEGTIGSDSVALALCRTPFFAQLIEKVGSDFHKARMASLDEHPEKLRELMEQPEAQPTP
jgi:hypothetical protein